MTDKPAVKVMCKMVRVNHDSCPDILVCYSDPCVLLEEHAATVTEIKCPNEAVEGKEYCAECLQYIGKVE